MQLTGTPPEVGSLAQSFVATDSHLLPRSLNEFVKKQTIIYSFPSINTSLCFDTVKQFDMLAGQHQDCDVIAISMDLPFALKAFKEKEGIQHITLISDFRNREFARKYNVLISNGPLAGLLARAVFVLDHEHTLIDVELVNDIGSPPRFLSNWADSEQFSNKTVK